MLYLPSPNLVDQRDSIRTNQVIVDSVVLALNKALLQADEVIDALERVGDENLADYLLIPANAAKLARAMIAASIRLGLTGSSR